MVVAGILSRRSGISVEVERALDGFGVSGLRTGERRFRAARSDRRPFCRRLTGREAGMGTSTGNLVWQLEVSGCRAGKCGFPAG